MNNIVGNNPNLEQLKIDNPKQWFREVLCDEDFDELERLFRESNGKIDWSTLVQDGVCEINNRKIIGIIWPNNLDLKHTLISSLWKIKEVKGSLNLSLSGINSLGELVSVGGICDLGGTNLLSLSKLKIIGSDFILESPGLIEVGQLEKIGGDLLLISMKLEFQLKIVEKINNGILELVGAYFSNYNLLKYFKNNALDFDLFIKDFGNNINNINDNEIKLIFKELLNIEYRRLIKTIKDNIICIQDKNKIVQLNSQLIKTKKNMLDLGVIPQEIDFNLI